MRNYGIRSLRFGVPTDAKAKNGERLKFDSLNAARRYMNKAREDEPNNPVTFMNRVDICEWEDDNFIRIVEHY